MPHNVDFHSATGALGGAKLTNVNPGEQATFSPAANTHSS